MSIDSKQPELQVPDNSSAAQKERPAGGLQQSSGRLYDIAESDGSFEATMPGFWDKEKEQIVGTSRERFATREEAEAAVGKGRESMRVLREKTSLEKTYRGSIFRIDETEQGKFRVTLPGLKHEKGYYIGTSVSEFDSWDEAKEHLLTTQEQEARLTQKPLLELQTGEKEKVAFSSLEAFNPIVAPSETAQEVPASVKNYLLGGTDESERNGMSTYEQTVKEKDWERKLFSFVGSYLTERSPQTLRELGITRLDALTPKQAVDLTAQVVIDLTKYKPSDIDATEGHIVDISKVKREKTAADTSTALQLLQEGAARKDDPAWEGNGVCRNFASTTKAVFEALKAGQTRFSKLRDTYCVYETSYAFDPERESDWDRLEFGKVRVSHAWNTFITVSKDGNANATIVDATWGGRNLDTHEIEGLDHTLKRMEPIVFAVANDLADSAPDPDTQIQHALSYYGVKLAAGVDRPEERDFLVSRAIDLMKKQKEIGELPQILSASINTAYGKMAGKVEGSEIETIFRASRTNAQIEGHKILATYLKDKRLTDYHSGALIFQDDELQRVVFEEVKRRPEFDAFLKESPAFRIRMREVVPGLFMDFSPGTKSEDAAELKELIGRLGSLAHLGSRVDVNNPSPEMAGKVFGVVRKKLREMNPERFDEVVGRLDDYEVVKQFDDLARALRTQ